MERTQKYLIYAVFGLSMFFSVGANLIWLLQCRPVSYYWNKDQDGSCISREVVMGMEYAYSVQALFCDMTFAILPIVLIRGILVDRLTRVAAKVILGLGCLLVLSPNCEAA